MIKSDRACKCVCLAARLLYIQIGPAITRGEGQYLFSHPSVTMIGVLAVLIPGCNAIRKYELLAAAPLKRLSTMGEMLQIHHELCLENGFRCPSERAVTITITCSPFDD